MGDVVFAGAGEAGGEAVGKRVFGIGEIGPAAGFEDGGVCFVVNLFEKGDKALVVDGAFGVIKGLAGAEGAKYLAATCGGVRAGS